MVHEMKVDEGYSGGSEETRSLSDSDSTMHLDPVDGHVSKSSTPTPESMLSGVLTLPPEQRAAFITSLLRLLPESERYGICNLLLSASHHSALTCNRHCLLGLALAAHLVNRRHSRTPQPSAPPRPRRLLAARDYISNLPPPLPLGPPPMLYRLQALARTCSGQQSMEDLLRPRGMGAGYH